MNEEKQTPAELIEELDGEAQKFTVVVIVVIFELAKTIFILSDNTDRLSVLTGALARGGEVIGFIAVNTDRGGSSFYRRTLPEYERDECFSLYLASLTDEIKEMLRQETFESSPTWVN